MGFRRGIKNDFALTANTVANIEIPVDPEFHSYADYFVFVDVVSYTMPATLDWIIRSRYNDRFVVRLVSSADTSAGDVVIEWLLVKA